MAGWMAAAQAAVQIGSSLMSENQARDDATTAWNRQLYMANNAMQMRVGDLQKAGLNPMLAAGGGLGGVGMTTSAPPIQTQAMQAPQIATTAAQIQNMQAQTELTKAQASKTRWETGDQGVPIDKDGNPDWTRAGGGVMGNYNAQQTWQGIQNMKATYENIIQQTKTSEAQQNLTDTQKQIASLNLEQQRQLFQTVIAKAKADLGLTGAQATDAEAVAKITGNPTWGPIIKLFRMIVPGGYR